MSSSPGGAVHLATRTGTNFAGAACDLSPPAPTNSTSFRLWESSGLKALLWEAKASVVATNAPPRWHRHFYKRRVPKGLVFLHIQVAQIDERAKSKDERTEVLTLLLLSVIHLGH